MLGWIWGCMTLSFKVALGGFFWVIAIAIVCFAIAGMAYVLNELME